MLPIRRAFLVASAALGLATPVAAQFPQSFYTAPTDMNQQEELQLLLKNSVQGGPYLAKIKSYPGSPVISVYCVDMLHSVQPNDEWYVNVNELVMGDMEDTRLGIAGDDADALSRYKKAAWLASNFASNQNATDWWNLQVALWSVVIPGDNSSNPFQGQYGDWLNKANLAEAGGYDGFNFNYWRVLTDVRADYNDEAGSNLALQPGKQEYLVYVTPEPETVIMMLSGMLVLFAVWRRGGVA